MKRAFLSSILLFVIVASAYADGLISLFELGAEQSKTDPRPPQLDPKRIVNESNSFMKDREPEMTAEEYAIYEKVVTVLTTNVDFALKMLEAMMNEKEPPSPAFEFILGNVQSAANQTERAEKNYRSAVTRYPNFLRAWNNLGLLYYTSSRFGEAIDCFAKSVTLGDRNPTTFGLLGYCLEKEHNVVAAEMAYMQAMSGDPRNPDWKEGLLRIYVNGKQFGRAEALVENLIKEQPNEPRFWLTYASILLPQHRQLEAAALLETAAAMGATDPEELLLLGDLYADLNLASESVAIYQKVPDVARDRSERKLIQLAQVLIAAGKLPDAEQALRALKPELTPTGRLAVLQTRADLAIAHKHWPEARQEVETLLKSAPLDGRGLLTLGQTYLEEQNIPRATFAFEAAYRIPEATYRASLELANIELKNRHYNKTVEYLEKALSIEKTDTVEGYLARVRALAARPADPS
jgi:tetratricopeptide (TPR) repeat protein